CLYRLVDFLLDVSDTPFVQVLHSKVHTRPVRVHLTACNLHAELLPDDATENMQRGMRPHHLIAEIPVDRCRNFRAYRWRRAIERMPDEIIALIHCDHAAPS